MAVLELNALSVALSGSFSATVVFPDQPSMEGKAYPALYFLHDVGGNDADIRTVDNLEALANELGLFIICPNVMRSYGMDLAWGAKYGDFVSRELPGICRHMLPLDGARQFIGGQGGGAYGAYWHAAHHPEAFSKCVLVNGHYDIAALCEAADRGDPIPETVTVPGLQALFGVLSEVRGGKFDVLCPENPAAGNVFIGCEEDFPGLSVSAAFAKQLKTALFLGKNREAVFDAGLRGLVQ